MGGKHCLKHSALSRSCRLQATQCIRPATTMMENEIALDTGQTRPHREVHRNGRPPEKAIALATPWARPSVHRAWCRASLKSKAFV